MKRIFRILLIAPILLFGCSVNKPIINNSAQIANYKAPFKVFSIGNWSPGYSIVTLVDNGNQFFTLKTIQNDSLKIGSIYQP